MGAEKPRGTRLGSVEIGERLGYHYAKPVHLVCRDRYVLMAQLSSPVRVTGQLSSAQSWYSHARAPIDPGAQRRFHQPAAQRSQRE